MSKILCAGGSDCVSWQHPPVGPVSPGAGNQRLREHHRRPDSTTTIALAPHEVLYRAGDPAQAVFTIRSGLLKLVQVSAGRAPAHRSACSGRPPMSPGLESLLGQPYQHDAIVLQQSEVCRISAGSDPAAGAGIIPSCARNLIGALAGARWTRRNAWLTQLATAAPGRAMARLLQSAWPAAEEDGSCELFGREDMGSMLGITTETASTHHRRIQAAAGRCRKFPQRSLNVITPRFTRLPPMRIVNDGAFPFATSIALSRLLPKVGAVNS